MWKITRLLITSDLLVWTSGIRNCGKREHKVAHSMNTFEE